MRLEISGARTPARPSPLQGEETLLAEQGAYQAQGRPVWQSGKLCLTGERLLFLQPRGIIFDTPLARITEIATESKRFTVVRKMAMVISYHDSRQGGVAKAWFITPSLGQWLNHLTQMISGQERGLDSEVREQGSTGAEAPRGRGAGAHGSGGAEVRGSSRGFTSTPLPPSTPTSQHPCPPAPPPPSTSAQDLERLAMELDPASREILWHLWLNRYATISELAELIAAPTHMDILFRIRQGINPTAEEVLGHPILVFEESRLDRETGEVVPFSWWLVGRVAPAVAGREPEVEVFNEAHEINVIVALPGVEEEAIRVSAQREKVVVWVEGADPATGLPSTMVRTGRTGVGYHEEVPLPAPVDAERVVTHFRNGILIVNLKKI